MRILITNDDGIDAVGIHKLIEIANRITKEVYVVAPDGQRSGVSHSFTIQTPLTVKEVKLAAKEAYSCSGTPSDCVKVAMGALLKEKPDLVLSGINHGYNMGYDTVYSGTVAAAREARYWGVASIAVSTYWDQYELVDLHLEHIIRDLMQRPLAPGEFFNVNFPQCGVEGYQGIKETFPASRSYFYDTYQRERIGEREWKYSLKDERCYDFEEGSDMNVVETGYISIEKLQCHILDARKMD